jgi:cobalt-zinc-cadmium efflux system protein
MAHAHAHHHHPDVSGRVSRKLIVATVATALFVVIELAIGWMSGSLALVSDALHNFTDAVALLLALFAVRLERRPPNPQKSYGYHRAGVLAAFINAGTLAAFTLFIFIEAFGRLRTPHAVDSTLMLITAAIALVLNGTMTWWLRDEGKHDLNIRGAVVHLLGDAVSSAGIIVAALLIRSTGAATWDPAISIAIGVLILWSSFGILRETINLLLEGTPSSIDPDAVTRSLGAIDGILGVHHLHIWALAPSRPALSCHLMVGDVPLKSTHTLLTEVSEMLAHEYRIAHTTVQFEFTECNADDPYCVAFPRR